MCIAGTVLKSLSRSYRFEYVKGSIQSNVQRDTDQCVFLHYPNTKTFYKILIWRMRRSKQASSITFLCIVVGPKLMNKPGFHSKKPLFGQVLLEFGPTLQADIQKDKNISFEHVDT